MVNYSILGTGSCGNSYSFTFDGTTILVDAGYSLRQITLRMQGGGSSLDTAAALFLTHLHPDHARSAGLFARTTRKPVFLTQKSITLNQHELLALNLPADFLNPITPGQPISIGPFTVQCFYTSHDSAGSCGYTINVDNKQFVIVTDTGIYTPEMLQAAQAADVLFLESNYDPEMLRTGRYPYFLQKRVSGNFGHLSNDQAKAFLLQSGYDTSGKLVHLIHLSGNNNTVDLVQQVMTPFNAHVCQRGATYHYTLS